MGTPRHLRIEGRAPTRRRELPREALAPTLVEPVHWQNDFHAARRDSGKFPFRARNRTTEKESFPPIL